MPVAVAFEQRRGGNGQPMKGKTPMRKFTALALSAATAAALVTTAAPASAAETATETECAYVAERVVSLEGDVTPASCLFMTRQTVFGGMPTLPDRQVRVDAYASLWAPDATLWEAASPVINGVDAIRASINATLTLVPEFGFTGDRVVADGDTVMFGADNFAVIKGHTVAYDAVYRVLLDADGDVVQGRRYYDRSQWFAPIAELPAPFAGIRDRDTRPGPARPCGLRDRAEAWNTGDVDALLAGMSRARLTAPGLDRPLESAAAKREYLTRLFAEATDIEFAPGLRADGEGGTYVEWHGTITAEGRTGLSFGIIEHFGTDGTWELTFDTLPLVAGKDRITELYGLLAS